MQVKKIYIVGAGFGGVRTALDLAKKKLPNVKIILVSNKPHFEYHAALYRVVAGTSPLEVCVPLREIFSDTPVDLVQDKIQSIDLKKRQLHGQNGQIYAFDYLVLGLGSENAFYHIPGLEENAFRLKSIQDALALKRHLHEVLSACQRGTTEEKICAAHVIVVGGGASGVEIAGQLGSYLKILARQHGLDGDVVTIDLIEGAPRLLPFLPASVSSKIKTRLHKLGVNIFLNRTIVKQELEEVFLKDLKMKTKTLIWTAGTTPNSLFAKISGLDLEKKGRVLVNSQLQTPPWKNVFVVGDAAYTPYSGTALTALDHGKVVAQTISHLLGYGPLPSYQPKQHLFSIPIGPGWAASGNTHLVLYGCFGWFIRRWLDLRFFLSILPPGKAWTAFRSGKQLVESCPVCFTGQ